MKPKVSIITINYNNAEGLRKSVESLISQTFHDYEYIVIDGGSTDGSREIILAHSYNISHWVSEKDNGIYNAMNKGIAAAKGEYCYFLNSGDTLHASDTLSQIFAGTANADTIYGDIMTDHKVVTHPTKLTATFLAKSTICHQAMFIKTALFKKFGFYREELRLVADWEFLCKTILNSKTSYKHVDVVICNYDDSGISSNPKTLSLLTAEREKVIAGSKPYLYNGFYLDKLNDAILRFDKKEILLFTGKINWLRVDLRETWSLTKKLLRHFLLFSKNLPKKFLNA